MAIQLTGHNVSVSFDLLEDVTFYCKSVTPPSYEAGEPIDVTTNATTGLKAYVSPDLAEPGEMSFTAAYDPTLDETVKGIIGKKGTTTLTFGKCSNRDSEFSATFPDTYIKSYAPQALSTGSMPEVQITIGFPGGTYDGSTGGEA
jgi:hypothetical protein